MNFNSAYAMFEMDENDLEEDKPLKRSRAERPTTSSCPNCKNVRKYIDEKFQNLTDMILAQNTEILKALQIQNQSIQIKNLAKSEQKSDENYDSDDQLPILTFRSIQNLFPICSVNMLQDMDDEINDQNHDLHVSVIRSIIRDNFKKTINNLFGKDVVMNINLDGTHGKTRFKDFRNIYNALKEAIDEKEAGTNGPEQAIRNAFQHAKKHYYIKTSIARRNQLRLDAADPLNY